MEPSTNGGDGFFVPTDAQLAEISRACLDRHARRRLRRLRRRAVLNGRRMASTVRHLTLLHACMHPHAQPQRPQRRARDSL